VGQISLSTQINGRTATAEQYIYPCCVVAGKKMLKNLIASVANNNLFFGVLGQAGPLV